MDRARARIANEKAFCRRPPHFVGVKLVDEAPVEPALMMMDPNHAFTCSDNIRVK